MDERKNEEPSVQVIGPQLLRRATECLIKNEEGIKVQDTGDNWTSNQVTVLLGLVAPNVQQFLQDRGAARTILVTSEAEMRTGLFRQHGLTVFVGEQEQVSALRDAILHAAQSEAYCSPSLIAPLIEAARHLSEVGEALPASPRLSEREQEIAQLALSGWHNDKIAGHLHVSTSTVKYHLFNAYRKLGVHRRADLRDALARQHDRPTGQGKLDRPV